MELWNTQPTNGSKGKTVACPLMDTGVFRTFRWVKYTRDEGNRKKTKAGGCQPASQPASQPWQSRRHCECASGGWPPVAKAWQLASVAKGLAAGIGRARLEGCKGVCSMGGVAARSPRGLAGHRAGHVLSSSAKQGF